MTATIPVLLSANFSSSNPWNGSDAWAGVMVGSATGTNPAANSSGNPLNYIAVFDRKNPTAGPVFQANAPDNTTVPAGLDQYLTTDYMFFWASAAYVTAMPQGALFDMLAKNGGGGQLQRMETLSTKFACGINGCLVYLLASVPNSGISGIEFMEQRAITVSQGTTPVYSYKNAPYQMLLDLVPSADGSFTPVNPY